MLKNRNSSLPKFWIIENRNSSLPKFWGIALCLFYTLNIARHITLKLKKIPTLNFVRRYISFRKSAVQKTRNFALPNFRVIALRLFYIMNFFRDKCLKLQKIPTLNFVSRYISFRKSALHQTRNSVFPNFWVIALCLFYTLSGT